MNLDAMTPEQLDALLEDLDRQRLELKERGRQAQEVRARKAAGDNAAAHGLTAEAYAAAKEAAAAGGKPLALALAEARRGALQVAKAQPATAGVKAKGV